MLKKLIVLAYFSITSSILQAQELPTISDLNGDGQVALACFGDSITYGVGDGTSPGDYVEISPLTDGGQGYHRRIEERAGFSAENHGEPGESLTISGLDRLVGVVQSSRADFMVIFEGANDSVGQVSSESYTRSLQQAINMAYAADHQPVLVTIPPPCCSRGGREIFTREYSKIVRDRANINDALLADVERAWDSTCQNKEACELFNVPDGIHPNSLGYDVVADVILGSLYGINVFATDGPNQLESALNLPAGTVKVKPDEAVVN